VPLISDRHAGHARRVGDGKTVRGTWHASGDGQAVHLLAVADQRAGAVLGQVGVDGKTSEITRFIVLLELLELAGCVVTADAMHAQREDAEFLVTEKTARYILTVKNNQPGFCAQVKNLPWGQVPVACAAREQGHGRAGRRALRLAAVAAGLAFPHAARAIQVIRRRWPLNGKKK
jgi:hypothetical protein